LQAGGYVVLSASGGCFGAAGVQRCHTSNVTCLCGAPIVCTLCESCAADCQATDPVRCAADALAFARGAYGEDDVHTRDVRAQLEAARANDGRPGNRY
jgi:hypothetical protein